MQNTSRQLSQPFKLNSMNGNFFLITAKEGPLPREVSTLQCFKLLMTAKVNSFEDDCPPISLVRTCREKETQLVKHY